VTLRITDCRAAPAFSGTAAPMGRPPAQTLRTTLGPAPPGCDPSPCVRHTPPVGGLPSSKAAHIVGSLMIPSAPHSSSSPALPLRDALLAEARGGLLDGLRQSLRIIGFSMPDVVEIGTQAAGECFDELARLKDRRGFEMARSLTASRISLLHEADLEFSIRLTDLARHLREVTEEELHPLHMRFVRLLDQRDASDEQTPVGPDAACAALRAIVEEAGLEPEMRLHMLVRAEAPFGVMLLDLYKRLNERFEAAGIPSSMNLRPRSETRPPELPAGGALHQLQQRLISANAAHAMTSHSLDPGLSAALREQVLSWLADQQAARAGRPTESPLQGLGASGLAGLLSVTARASLEAISQLFEALFADADVSAVIKGLIGRLQIPMLRLALTDEGVLTRADHPARRLVDALGAATIGHNLPHAELAALHGIIDALEKRSAIDAPAFSEALRGVERRTQVLVGQIETAVEPFTAVSLREEQREGAVRLASQALRALCEDAAVPVANFLQHYWVRVLIGALSARGERSDIWRSLLETAHRLVQSGQPCDTPEQREALTRALPDLVRRIDAGLALVGLDEAGRRQALGPCLDMHTARMRGLPVPAAEAAPPRVALRWRGVPDAPGLRIARAPEYLPREPAHLPVLDTLAVGMALVCTLPDLAERAGTIAWVGPQRRVLLWVTQGLDGCCLLPMRWLADALVDGSARLPASANLFERLAARALAQ
jgi:hypothetical protein